MKRVISFIFAVVFALTMVGCNNQDRGTQNGNGKDNIIDLSEGDSITTTNSEYSISFEISGNKIDVFGTLKSDEYKYLMVIFNKDTFGDDKIRVDGNSFSGTFELPDENEVVVELYGGKEEYGSFESIIIDFIKVENVGDTWQFVQSPVLENNREIFSQTKDVDDYLSATWNIQSDDTEIIELANSITLGIEDDYDKVRAIHDWVATNIFYDFDALSAGNYEGMDAKNVLLTQKGVCEGYANIMAALLRSQNIPCNVRGGFALGEGTVREWTPENISDTEGNHAWNEVYVDGRWIIIDATWDSKNEYRNGMYVAGDSVGDLYFDSTLEFFSFSHKLIR